MAIETLFTTETPDSGLGDNADLTPAGATATTMVFAVAGTVRGIRFYAPATVNPATTFTAELWECTGTDGVSNGTGTGTLLASKAATGITAGTWNVINFDTPVSVVTTKTYRHVIHNAAGRYVAAVGYFATAHTNGNVTGVQSGSSQPGVSGGTIRNGTFIVASAGSYPNNFFNTPSYLVDTQFEVAGGQTIAVGTATETDAAFSVSRTKTRAVGTATETDSATAIAGRSKARAVTTATETDAAIAITTTVPDVAASGSSSVSAPFAGSSSVSAPFAGSSSVSEG